jgi:hypothetical protein
VFVVPELFCTVEGQHQTDFLRVGIVCGDPDGTTVGPMDLETHPDPDADHDVQQEDHHSDHKDIKEKCFHFCIE